jgi:hypothetical protein
MEGRQALGPRRIAGITGCKTARSSAGLPGVRIPGEETLFQQIDLGGGTTSITTFKHDKIVYN